MRASASKVADTSNRRVSLKFSREGGEKLAQRKTSQQLLEIRRKASWAKREIYDKGGKYYLYRLFAQELSEAGLQIYNFWVLTEISAPYEIYLIYIAVVSVNILSIGLITSRSDRIAFDLSLRLDIFLEMVYAAILPIVWLYWCVINIVTAESTSSDAHQYTLIRTTQRLFVNEPEELLTFAAPMIFLVSHLRGVSRFDRKNAHHQMRRPPRWVIGVVGVATVIWVVFASVVMRSLRCDDRHHVFGAGRCRLSVRPRWLFSLSSDSDEACSCAALNFDCEGTGTSGASVARYLGEAFDPVASDTDALRLIDATRCNISEIPTTIRHARRLVRLSVPGNRIAGLPSEVWGLPLMWLDVSSNFIRSIPRLDVTSLAAKHLTTL